jgi:hypothetical protein
MSAILRGDVLSCAHCHTSAWSLSARFCRSCGAALYPVTEVEEAKGWWHQMPWAIRAALYVLLVGPLAWKILELVGCALVLSQLGGS